MNVDELIDDPSKHPEVFRSSERYVKSLVECSLERMNATDVAEQLTSDNANVDVAALLKPTGFAIEVDGVGVIEAVFVEKLDSFVVKLPLDDMCTFVPSTFPGMLHTLILKRSGLDAFVEKIFAFYISVGYIFQQGGDCVELYLIFGSKIVNTRLNAESSSVDDYQAGTNLAITKRLKKNLLNSLKMFF